MFVSMARASELWLSKFNVQALANTVWAFATVKHPDEKLLAALNLPQVGEIKVEDDNVFSIELNERVYKLKAANEQEAQKWVETLKVLKDSEKKRAESTKPTSASGGAETAAPTSTTDKQASGDWEKSKGCCRLCRG